MDDRGKCPKCGHNLGIGFGMGNIMKACRCKRNLIWIPTLEGGHWELLTIEHLKGIHEDLKECILL